MFLGRMRLNHRLSHIPVRTLLLAIAWISGILIGFYAARGTVHFAIVLPITGFGLSGYFLVIALPVIISTVSIRCFLPLILVPLAFTDAFIFAYCSYFIQFSFGNSGWLFRWMLMFSDSAMAVILLLFWIRNVDGHRSRRKDLKILYFISGLIGCIDYFVVSPFFAQLLLQ